MSDQGAHLTILLIDCKYVVLYLKVFCFIFTFFQIFLIVVPRGTRTYWVNPLFFLCQILSLYLSFSIFLTNNTHNWMVEFHSRSRGKGSIRLFPLRLCLLLYTRLYFLEHYSSPCEPEPPPVALKFTSTNPLLINL